MATPEMVAEKYGLEYLPRGEWHGANPFENGATDDGFILFETGNAYDRKLQKSYSRHQVFLMAGPDFTEPKERPIMNRQKIVTKPQTKKEIIDYSTWTETIYNYNVSDVPYARVVRLDPPKGLIKSDGKPHKKTFRQQKYVNGHWVNGAPDSPVLYRHDKVVWSANIIVVEGEKAADSINNRLGNHHWIATTNAGGTGNTRAWARMAPALAGKRVVIIPDNDEPGLKHAKAVEGYCSRLSNVSTIRLSGLAIKEDVADWLEHHDIEELFSLIERRKA